MMTTNRMGLEQQSGMSNEFIDSLAERVDHADCYGGKTWFDCHEGAVIIACLRELLAYREASKEPVASYDKYKDAEAKFEEMNIGFPVSKFKADYVIGWCLKNLPIHAAPQFQAVTVPDEIPEALKDKLINICDLVEDNDEYCQDIWNACRAAMLNHSVDANNMVTDNTTQQFESLSSAHQPGTLMNEGTIPDGWQLVPKIPTREMWEATNGKASWIDKYKAMLAAVPQRVSLTNEGKWIPVSERMPDVGDVVLTAKDGCVNVGESERAGAIYRYFTSIVTGRDLSATHWMPLPAAPEVDK